MPDDGLIWTPGYWAYDDDQGEYYWVDGAWVQPPQVGFYWTPAYWAWNNGAYGFYPGYWGPTVGFYGGVNYGHGYWGRGYGGGRWENDHFAYNTAANNVGNAHVYRTYADRNGYRPESANRVSYNGGHGGVTARPTSQEQQAIQAQHVQPTPQQQTHFQQAAQQRTHQVKVDKAAAKLVPTPGAAPVAATGAQPNAQPAGQPAVNKQDNAATGGNPQHQKKDHPADQTPAAVNNTSPALHRDQVKTPEDARVTGQEPAAVKHEVAPVEQPAPVKHVAPVEQPAVNAQPHVIQQNVAPQPAAQEQHHAQGPGAGASAVPHAAAPQNHPAAQAKHEENQAPAQGQPQPQGGQGGGQGPQGGGGGGQQRHQDGH